MEVLLLCWDALFRSSGLMRMRLLCLRPARSGWPTAPPEMDSFPRAAAGGRDDSVSKRQICDMEEAAAHGGRGGPAPGRQCGAAARVGHRGRYDVRQPRALRCALRPPRIQFQRWRQAGPCHRRGCRRQDHQGEAAQAQGRLAPPPGVPANQVPRDSKGDRGTEASMAFLD